MRSAIIFVIAVLAGAALAEIRDARGAQWTLAVDMQDAPDLRPFAAWNLREIEGSFPIGDPRRAGSSGRVEWLAQLGSDRWHLEDSGVEFVGARSAADYRGLDLSDIRSTRLAPESGDSVDFNEWVRSRYPAAHHALVIWGHGAGWDARVLPALRERLARGQPLDWIAFDACLMQTLEIATELADQARFITGSAQVQSFIGLPYRRLMVELNAGRASTPEALALEVPRWFQQSLSPGGLHSRLDDDTQVTQTLSTVDTRALREELWPAWEQMSRALIAYLAERPWRRLHWQSVLLSNQRSAAGFLGGTQDLGVWLTSLQVLVRTESPNSPELRGAAAELDLRLLIAHRALANTVPRYSLGTLYTSPEASPYWMGFRGVSLWQPTSREEWLLGAPDFAVSRLYREAAPTWKAVQAAVFEL